MGLRERKKIAAWRAIRGAALGLFDEHGYEAVSVEQIATAAEVSRATFFNYFASKEAVVFDRDPEERDGWCELMTQRPADEPLWDALTAVLTAYARDFGQLTPLRRRLKEASPALARSNQDHGTQLVEDLRTWVLSRVVGEEWTAALLQLNVVMAASRTAYDVWRPEQSYEEYLALLDQCLVLSGRGFATRP